MTRRISINRLAPAIALCAAVTSPALAQLELPRLSPRATVSQIVGLTDVTIAYCRPAVRERTIWGELVPFGEVWRTGANEATTITFSSDVTVEGKPVPAGTYGLFTIPGKDLWTVIINKGAKQWGAYDYKAEEDLFRFTVTPQPAPFTERLTFTFPNTTTDSAEIALTWEKVHLGFTVKVDIVGKVLVDARKAIAELKTDDWRTPLRAASFCLDNNVNLDEARGWAEKSLAVKETMYGLAAKARFVALDGDTAAAIVLARKAIEVGKAADPKADTTSVERLIAGWSK